MAAAVALSAAAAAAFAFVDKAARPLLVRLSQTPEIMVGRELITPFGQFWRILALLALIWLWGKAFNRPSAKAAFLPAAASMTVAGLAALAIKLAVFRPRPFIPPERLADLGSGYYQSFPSSDAACIVAAAAAVAVVCPRYRWSAYTVAAAVSLMRVLKLAHWPSDVLAGAAIGLAAAAAVSAFSDRRAALPEPPGQAIL